MIFEALESSGKANRERDVFGARAKTALLATTEEEGVKLDVVRNIECADTFRAGDLGGVKRQEVDTEAGDIDVEKRKPLRSVRVQKKRGHIAVFKTTEAFVADDFGDSGDGLDSSKLVVSERNRDELDRRSEFFLKIFEVDGAVFIDRDKVVWINLGVFKDGGVFGRENKNKGRSF